MATAGAYSGSPTEKILQWIDEVTETGAGGGSDLSCLKNGIALCQLANALMPGAIKKINTRKISMVAFMENMPAFVKFLQDGVEMEDHLIFECQAFQTDLEPGSRDADKVERCLVALGQMAEGIDGYEGKYLAADAGGAAERSSSKVKPVSDEDAAAIKAEEEAAAEAAAPKKVEKEKEKVAKTAAAEKKKRAADALIKKNEEESAKAEVKAQQEAEAAAAKAKAQEEEEAAAAAKAREEAAAAAAAAKAQADAAAEVQAAEVQAAKAAAAEAAAALEEEAAVATATAALTQEPEPSAAPTEGPIPGTDWERIADGDGDLYFSNSVMETTWEAPAEVTAAEAPGAAAPVEEPIEEPEPEIDQSEMIAAMKAKKEAAAAAKAEAAAAEAERQATAVQLQAQPAIVDPRLQIVATDSHGGVMAGSPRGAESGGAKGLSAPTGVTPGEAIRVRSYSGSQREQPGAESATSAADVDAEPAANPRLQTLATDDDGNAFAGSPRAGGGADSLFAPSGVAPGEMVKITQRQPAVEQLLAPAPEPEPELVEEVQETTVHYNTTRDADSHDTATLAEFRNLWASGALNSDTTIYMEKTGVWERCGAHVDSLGLAILVDDDEAERRTGRSVAPAPAPAPYLSRRSEAADVWAQAEDGAGLTSAFSKTHASRDEYACARVVTDESYDDGVETRGREDCLQKNWAQMNADERRAALALGWTDESWEAASNVGWMHLWSDLTAEHREAAGVLSITSEMLATEVYVQYLKLKETADNPAIYTDQDMKELRQQADAAQEHFLVQQQGLKQQLEDKERELVDLAGSQTAAQRRQEEQIKERIKAEVAESVARDVQSRLREYARAAEAAQEAAVAAAIEKTRAEVIESRSGADQQRDYQQQMYDESLEAWGAIKQRQEQYHTEMVELQQSLKDQHELEQTVATMRGDARALQDATARVEQAVALCDRTVEQQGTGQGTQSLLEVVRRVGDILAPALQVSFAPEPEAAVVYNSSPRAGEATGRAVGGSGSGGKSRRPRSAERSRERNPYPKRAGGRTPPRTGAAARSRERMSPAALAGSDPRQRSSPAGSAGRRTARHSPTTAAGGARGSDLIEFSFRGARDVSTGINLQLVKADGRDVLEVVSIDSGTAAAHNELLRPGLVLAELQRKPVTQLQCSAVVQQIQDRPTREKFVMGFARPEH